MDTLNITDSPNSENIDLSTNDQTVTKPISTVPVLSKQNTLLKAFVVILSTSIFIFTIIIALPTNNPRIVKVPELENNKPSATLQAKLLPIQSQIPIPTSNNLIPTPLPTPITTQTSEGWKAYTNNKIGYYIEFPERNGIFEKDDDTNTVLIGGENTEPNIIITLLNLISVSPINSEWWKSNFYNIYDTYMVGDEKASPKHFLVEETEVNGLKAVHAFMLAQYCKDGSSLEYIGDHYFFQIGENIVKFNFHHNSPDLGCAYNGSQISNIEKKKILSSIKFTE